MSTPFSRRLVALQTQLASLGLWGDEGVSASLRQGVYLQGSSSGSLTVGTYPLTTPQQVSSAQSVVSGWDWSEANPPKTADELSPLVATLQTQVAALQAAPGDPWSYLKLTSDFPTGSASAVNITGMGFSLLANTRYEFEGVVLIRTATLTVGPRVGIAWPTGLSDGVCRIDTPSSATAATIVLGGINASLLAAVGGLPLTTASYPVFVRGVAVTGLVAPVGNLRLQLASETALTNVTAKAGSFLKYRTY